MKAARRPLFFASSPVSCVDVASTAREERAAGFLTQVCADCFDRQPEFAGLEDCLSHGICERHFAEKLAEVRRVR